MEQLGDILALDLNDLSPSAKPTLRLLLKVFGSSGNEAKVESAKNDFGAGTFLFRNDEVVGDHREFSERGQEKLLEWFGSASTRTVE